MRRCDLRVCVCVCVLRYLFTLCVCLCVYFLKCLVSESFVIFICWCVCVPGLKPARDPAAAGHFAAPIAEGKKYVGVTLNGGLFRRRGGDRANVLHYRRASCNLYQNPG